MTIVYSYTCNTEFFFHIFILNEHLDDVKEHSVTASFCNCLKLNIKEKMETIWLFSNIITALLLLVLMSHLHL